MRHARLATLLSASALLAAPAAGPSALAQKPSSTFQSFKDNNRRVEFLRK